MKLAAMDPRWALYGVAGGLLLFVAWRAWRTAGDVGQSIDALSTRVNDAVRAAGQTLSDAASATVDAVNPASDRNLAYRAAGSVTEAITGEQGATPGTAVYSDVLQVRRWLAGLGIGDMPVEFTITDPSPARPPTAGDFARLDRAIPGSVSITPREGFRALPLESAR